MRIETTQRHHKKERRRVQLQAPLKDTIGGGTTRIGLCVLLVLSLFQNYKNSIIITRTTQQETFDSRLIQFNTTPLNDGFEEQNIDVSEVTTASGTSTGTTQNRLVDQPSLAWLKAMQQADEMLALASSSFSSLENDDPTNNNNNDPVKASCLVPNLKGTEELVRERLKERRERERRRLKEGAATTKILNTFEEPLVPLPVLNMGMPKLGSTSLYEYFRCSGFDATHWNLRTSDYEGLCMRDAVRVGLPPLQTCALDRHAIMQMDVALPMGSKYKMQRSVFTSSELRDDCFFPQLSILEEIHDDSPHSTFIITFRPIEDWIRSMIGWYSFLERLQKCHLPNSPRGQPIIKKNTSSNNSSSSKANSNQISDDDDLESLKQSMTRFFCSHVIHLRNFVEAHPTHNLIELDLYNTNTSSQILDQLFPSSSANNKVKNNSTSCWQHANKSGGGKK